MSLSFSLRGTQVNQRGVTICQTDDPPMTIIFNDRITTMRYRSS
jgi:hypothetical protein